MGVVFPAKRHALVVNRKQTVIGNRDSMRVTRQVVQNVLRTAEGRLGVNDPLLPGDDCEKRCEVLFVGERAQSPKNASL